MSKDWQYVLAQMQQRDGTSDRVVPYSKFWHFCPMSRCDAMMDRLRR